MYRSVISIWTVLPVTDPAFYIPIRQNKFAYGLPVQPVSVLFRIIRKANGEQGLAGASILCVGLHNHPAGIGFLDNLLRQLTDGSLSQALAYICRFPDEIIDAVMFQLFSPSHARFRRFSHTDHIDKSRLQSLRMRSSNGESNCKFPDVF